MANNGLIEKAYNAIYDYLMNKSVYAPTYRAALKENARETKSFFGSDSDLFAVMIELRDEINHATAKNSGKGNLFKSMMKIIKDADVNYCGGILKGAYTDEKGRTCVTDSFSLIRTEEKVDLPQADLSNTSDGKWLNVDRIMPHRCDVRKVNIPTIAELKQYIKLNKNEPTAYAADRKEMVWFIRNDSDEAVCMVGAKRLLNILEAIGDGASAFAHHGSSARICPLWIVGEKTEALCCPMRFFDSDEAFEEKYGIKAEPKTAA